MPDMKVALRSVNVDIQSVPPLCCGSHTSSKDGV